MHTQLTTQSFSRRRMLGTALAAAGVATVGAAAVSAPTVGAAPAKRRGAAPEPSVPLSFQLLPAPVRVYDSRVGQAPEGIDPNTGAGDSPLLRTITRQIDVTYVLGASIHYTQVPGTASGVLLNVTCVNTAGASGYLKVWSPSAAEPAASSINWDHAGAVVANSVTSACSSGYIKVKCGGPLGASTDFIIDVVGFYAALPVGP